LNYNALQPVKFEVIKNMILGKIEREQVTVHTEKKIKRKRMLGVGVVSIISELEHKLYRIFIFGEQRLHENTSVPFGYK